MAWTKDNEEEAQKEYDTFVKRYNKNNEENKMSLSYTNVNSIYIPIKIHIEGFNTYELCAYLDSGCSICFGKRKLFPKYM